MKNILKTALFTVATLVLCLLAIPTHAQAASQRDLTFTLNEDGKSYYVSDCNTSASGSITVPATYNGKPVTCIGGYAFWDCSSLTSITIPDGVTSISGGAFDSCSSLTSITIPDSVTSIGYAAFSGCSSLTSITIPDTVTSIDSGAFYDCSNLTSITIPDSVTSIAYSTFSGCYRLENITIPSSVTSIESWAFADCYRLQSVDIPEGVTSIFSDTFVNCSSLKHVNIPKSVTGISSKAFYNCSSLESITIPENVTYISYYAFSFCKNLKTINFNAISCDLVSGSSNGVPYLPDWSNVRTVNIGENVTQIPEYAFYNCKELQSVTIPASVERVGRYAFIGCDNLLTVTYSGTNAQKEKIDVRGGNMELLNANWQCALDPSDPAYNVYTVIFVDEDGTELSKNTYHLGDEVIAPADPVRSADTEYAYSFAGWDQEITACAGNATYTATYKSWKYSDVSTSSWQISPVVYVCNRGLMAGKGTDGNGNVIFDPNKPISREEFVQVLYNAENKPSVAIANKFPDVGNNAWYKNAVLWANSQNIANGMGNGNFGVGKNITRQDLALMLYKYASLKGLDLTAPTGEINQYADGSKVSDYAQTAMNWAVKNGVLSGKGAAGADISTFRLDPAGTATRAECAAMLKNFMTAFGL